MDAKCQKGYIHTYIYTYMCVYIVSREELSPLKIIMKNYEQKRMQ